MSIISAIAIVGLTTSVAVGAMLLVRRRAPEGSVFEDGDRAAGVFGVLATGFSVLLGLIVFLAFSSYDESRSGAETEAQTIRQQFETAQFLPPAVRARLGGQLICYGRAVVSEEWPRLAAGTEGEALNPWTVPLFRTIKAADPKTVAEQTAYGNWMDFTTAREEARSDRVHGAVGVIPPALWVVLFFIAATIFMFMLFLADSGERWYAQAMLMGSVIAVITATLLLISVLDTPVREHGGLQPVAMRRTLRYLAGERTALGDRSPVPCDAAGVRVTRSGCGGGSGPGGASGGPSATGRRCRAMPRACASPGRGDARPRDARLYWGDARSGHAAAKQELRAAARGRRPDRHPDLRAGLWL